MARLKAISPEQASGKTKELFKAIEGKLGMVPNMMRTMANSPALLEGYLNLSGSLSHGTLGPKTSELLALAIAESNACNYCLSAHVFIGSNLVKLDPETLQAARAGNATEPKTAAILKLAKSLVSQRGFISDAELAAAKSAGVNDAEISEIIGHVGLNLLTNYFNNAVSTDIDFPVVAAQTAVAV